MPPELSPWIQYGVLGLVVAALIAGLLVTKGHADEIREQRKEAMDGWKSQTDATKELAGVLREQTVVIRTLSGQLEELLRREHPRGGRG